MKLSWPICGLALSHQRAGGDEKARARLRDYAGLLGLAVELTEREGYTLAVVRGYTADTKGPQVYLEHGISARLCRREEKGWLD